MNVIGIGVFLSLSRNIASNILELFTKHKLNVDFMEASGCHPGGLKSIPYQ